MNEPLQDPELEKIRLLILQRAESRQNCFRAERRKIFLKMGGMILLILLLVSFLFYQLSGLVRHEGKPILTPRIDTSSNLRAQILTLKQQLADARAGDGAPDLAPNQYIQELDRRLSSIESALGESPDKALSIPLLKREIADLVARIDENRAQIHAEIDRVHTQQAWLLGIIITLLSTAALKGASVWLKSLNNSKFSGG